MKFSDTTLTILKNFSKINPSIVVKPGNTIATVAPKTKAQIMGVATVPDSFINPFAIGDLSSFLGCYSLFNEPDLTFYEKFLTLNQGVNSLRYTFCDERAVTVPTKTEIPITDCLASFQLSKTNFKSLVNAGGQLDAPEYRFQTEAGFVTIKTCNSKNPSGNEYSYVGPESEETFDFLVDKDAVSLILFDRDYDIDISKNGVIRFKSEALTYYIIGKVER